MNEEADEHPSSQPEEASASATVEHASAVQLRAEKVVDKLDVNNDGV